MRAAWRRGPEIFAEVALPEEVAASARLFALHPALLDAALHPAASGPGAQPGTQPGEIQLASAWTGVSLYAEGASALRVRLRPDAAGGWSLAAADATGTPVLSVDSVVSRPIPADQLEQPDAGLRGALLTVAWVPLPAPSAAAASAAAAGRWAVVGADQPGLARGLAGAGLDVQAYQDLAALAAAARAGEPVPGRVAVWAGAVAGDACPGPGGLDEDGAGGAARLATGRMLELVQPA